MTYARILWEVPSHRIHRHDILGIVVFDGFKITELTRDCLLRPEKIGGLYIDGLTASGGYEIHLSVSQYPDIYVESLYDKMVPDYIFDYFLYTSAQIEAANQVS